MRRTAVTIVAVAGLTAGFLSSPAPAAVGTDSTALRNAVTVGEIMDHEAAFQTAADDNEDTRVAGSQGHVDSAEYVVDRLEDAGYTPVRQFFDFPFYQQLSASTFDRVSPGVQLYVEGTDYETMQYSDSGEVTGAVVEALNNEFPPGAEPSSSAGCAVSDFTPASATETEVALVQRGTCTFEEKAANAEAAGYDAAILFNEGQPGRTDVIAGTLGQPFDIPVLFSTFAVGEQLHNLADPVVHIGTSTLSETRETYNVYTDTAGGRTDRQVVVGGHLDSVADGPGINDNGSGVAAILEIAEQFAALDIQPRNQVRFAFWSAEEEGLIGSEYYVSQLTARQIKNTSLNLNLDMIASPNFVRFVYDGDGDETGTKGPAGSAAVEDVFLDYFDGAGMASEATAFDGRSDYGPFIAVGIPAGGLFTGAEGIKTAAQAVTYGGTAGIAYDPCYHQACDDFANVNTTAMDQMSDATAHAVLQFAMTTSSPGGTDKASSKAQANATALEFKGSHAVR